MTMTTFGIDAKSYIPKRAIPLIPSISENVEKILPGFGFHAYFPALIEQESCIRLTYKKCFGPKSRLYAVRKNGSKEEGAGMTQLTRVWRRNGTVRFDTLTGLTRKYPVELAGLNWKTVYDRPDLQILAAMLLWRDNFRSIKRMYGSRMKEIEMIAFADSAYNGGLGGLKRDVRLCTTTKGCDPSKWFGNVEYTCTKSKRALYGNRNACDINREHVRTIMFIRSYKYYVYQNFVLGDYK